MATYYGRNYSASYGLGQELGSGGEGIVYAVQGRPDLVAKIYSDDKFNPTAECASPRQYLREKIETMLDQPVNPYINSILSVAWPQDILFDKQGQFVGYIMPCVNSRYHIYEACRERERQILYPNYTWKTAILIAYNLTIAVKAVHDANAVIGDFNSNNIMLDKKGHVTLIDTDSFNIINKRTGQIYKCKVGIPDMLPPELQGKELAKSTSVFTEDTDNFALAIHIFNLLMNNCHPFGCVGMNKSQSSSSNNPVAHNIVKGNCPYVSGGKGVMPPNAPDVKILPKEVRQLFNRAFGYNAQTAIHSATIKNRPNAEEWKIALNNLYNSEMHTCTSQAPNIHIYPEHYAKCPWCEIKRASIPKARHVNPMRSAIPNSGWTSPAQVPVINGGRQSSIRRNSWPLWLICIISGCISGPLLMAQLLVLIVNSAFGFDLDIEIAYIILFIVGGICGAIVAHFGEGLYQRARVAWPCFFLGLLPPIGTALIIAALLFAIFVIVMAVTIILYIIAITFAISCVCGALSGG